MNGNRWPSTLDADAVPAPVLALSASFDPRPQPRERRVLFISYAFPPTGGGGVQRSVKFAKYLPEFGWRATVLTSGNPSVPLRDADLQGELDPSTTILRARTLEPPYAVKQALTDSGERRLAASARGLLRRLGMRLLQPDPQVLWNPGAMWLARNALRKTEHDAIYATGPPFSSFLLGRALKKRFHLPLVLDFRDEWLLSSQYLENYQLGKLARRRQRAMMNKCLQAADAVIATTKASADELARYCHQAGSRTTVACIHNGYDPADLAGMQSGSAESAGLCLKKPLDLTVSTPKPGERRPEASLRGRFREFEAKPVWRIAYTGTLWTLTDVAPIVSALKRVSSLSPEAASRIEFALAGRRTPEQDRELRRLGSTPVSVKRHGYLAHRRSLEFAASAQALLLLLADLPGAERVVPAKLFEYLALEKPILAICPPGETAQLLQQHGHASVFRPEETEKIAAWLMAHVEQRADRSSREEESPERSGSAIDRFSRQALTGELAGLLGGMVSRA